MAAVRAYLVPIALVLAMIGFELLTGLRGLGTVLGATMLLLAMTRRPLRD